VAPLAAAIADRFDPARMLALGYVVQAVGLALAGMAIYRDSGLLIVGVMAAIASAGFSSTRPVYLATVPDVVDTAEELTLGNAASAWVDGLGSVLGPLAAGIGLVLIGPAEVTLLLAIVVLLSAIASLGLSVTRRIRARDARVWSLLTGGFSVLRRDAQVRGLVFVTAAQYAVVGLLDVLVVVFVVDVLGLDSATAGILAGATGVGSMLGGVAAIGLAGRRFLTPAVVLGAIITGLPVLIMGLGPGLVVSCALMVGYGIGKSVVTVASQTLLQRTVDDLDSTRLFGVQESMIQGATALGAAVGPALVLVGGTRVALAVTGALLPLVVLILVPVLRRLDTRAQVPGPVFRLLRRIGFLSVLPLRSVEQLARQSLVEHVPAGTLLIREGDVGDRFYVLESGYATVQVEGASVKVLGPGEGFGEVALLHDVPRTATVTTDSPADVVVIDREDFLWAVNGTVPAFEAAHLTAERHLDADDRRRDRYDD